jgi:methylthioribulose-1-phosphate dehydratase
VIYDPPMAERRGNSKKRAGASSGSTYLRIAQSLSEISREFYRRSWVLGTSGNFSAVVQRKPLLLAVTQSGVDKGAVTPSQIVLVNGEGEPVSSSGRPSAEVLLHLTIVKARGAGAFLHTHSTWSTIASEAHAREHGLGINGYEMLKGLEGVHTHEHTEWLPIVDNSQSMATLARELNSVLERYPDCHGILLRRHGLYTWGESLPQAKRHVEILEFLLEVTSISDSRGWVG